MHPEVAARLERLDPEQRAAATAPEGPVLCLAPAGAGKTTTLVARIAFRVDRGVPPDRVCAIAFNRRAAEELEERVDAALEPLGVAPGTVRVRTFHALGLEILRSAGRTVEPIVDRDVVLRVTFPDAPPELLRRLDTTISRLKLDAGVSAADVEADPEPGPVGEAFLAYERALAATGGLDFDDLVARSLAALESDAPLLERWHASCAELLVDEVQDVDRAQLRLALLLAAPENRIFLVGDDDQSIYGWRLADVRRVLGIADALPGLRRVDLETNYRCPEPVVERSVRLVERNVERFAKRVRPRPEACGRLVLAPDGDDDTERIGRAFDTWPEDASTRALLTPTNRELVPGIAVALDRELPFRAARVRLLVEAPELDPLLEHAAATDASLPLLVRLGSLRDGPEPRLPTEGGLPHAAPVPCGRSAGAIGRADPLEPAPDTVSHAELICALLGWAVPFDDLDDLVVAIQDQRARLARLRSDDAPLSFATAHSTKGLEFDHVVVLMDASRFPSPRALADALEPGRALEEERRLAYVAWTRARRSLTLLYDPVEPSPFLLEAFTADELGL
ncbi:MAG TPA: ATP-dependent helicase [Candidatus Dormibacteraeota bacterium]|nr:ATP-dependent helicase [Candidatus Dormibacteraeota bacterium]